MESFQKLITLVKDKFLKKNKLNFFFKIILLIFFTKFLFANITDEKDILITYLQNIKNFSANFIQSDGQSIEEGMVYIGKNRIRVDYFQGPRFNIAMRLFWTKPGGQKEIVPAESINLPDIDQIR